ncbi:MAG: DUF4397 domain-containing protein [Thermoanaerobaculia bacterium]
MKSARSILAFSLLVLTFAASAHAATPLNALLAVDNATSNPGGVARLRVVHNSPDAPNVDVIVNGGVALADVPFGAISGYLEVPGGDYNVKVSPAGASGTGPYVIDADVSLAAGTDYTVIASGVLAEIYPAVLVDDNSAPAAGEARVRFFHGSPDAPAVDIALVGGPVLIPGAPFGADATIEVPAGKYDLEVRVAGTSTEVLQLLGVEFAAGGVYTAIASGLVAQGSADRTLYFGEADRFRVDATFTDFEGNSGVAKVLGSTSETGQFWFFSPSNVELLVKIFDGRATNNAFWVFNGAATNVAYTITVTDTEQDVQKVYSNPLGTFGSGGDIEAFPQ